MECPREMHLLAARRTFWNLQGTIDHRVLFKKGEKPYLFGFTDNDYASDANDRKNIFGYMIMMGSRAISWSSKKQPIF